MWRRKTDVKFSWPQTLEISQNRETFSRRRGHERRLTLETRDDRRRVAESPLARHTANATQKTEGKFSRLQTLEISQNRKIIS
jgi:hypothetical protein